MPPAYQQLFKKHMDALLAQGAITTDEHHSMLLLATLFTEREFSAFLTVMHLIGEERDERLNQLASAADE